jgi:hypothetical protein
LLAALCQRSGRRSSRRYQQIGTQSQRTTAFVQRLREFGWIEGRTVAIEYRWGAGHTERFAEIAAEFVRLKVDVIATPATPPTALLQSGRRRSSRLG